MLLSNTTGSNFISEHSSKISHCQSFDPVCAQRGTATKHGLVNIFRLYYAEAIITNEAFETSTRLLLFKLRAAKPWFDSMISLDEVGKQILEKKLSIACLRSGHILANSWWFTVVSARIVAPMARERPEVINGDLKTGDWNIGLEQSEPQRWTWKLWNSRLSQCKGIASLHPVTLLIYFCYRMLHCIKQCTWEKSLKDVRLNAGLAISQSEVFGRSVFKVECNGSVVLHYRFTVRELEPCVVTSSTWHTCGHGGWRNPPASVQNSNNGEIQVAQIRTKTMITDWPITSQRVLIGQWNSTFYNARPLVTCSSAPSFAD